MRKNMAKMAAALLSAALVVTSVNIPGTTSEAATAKISVAKKTLYAGGPSSRKVLTLAVKKGSKKLTGVTFTSSNKAVASVGKKTGLVTAKKKGTAVITAKVNGKKYTSKITVKKWVYATGFAAGATELTIEEGGSQVLTVAYNGDPTKKAAVFTSSDTSTVKVNKKTKKFKVKLTGEKVGTATITVKPAADVVKKADRAAMTQKVTVNVVPKSEAPSTEPSSEAPATDGNETPASEDVAPDRVVDHLEAEVTNSITKKGAIEYDGSAAVLTGQDGKVKVTAYDKDNKPVANAKIVLNMADNAIIGGLRYFMDQNTTTVTTDSNGVAVFVLRPQGDVFGRYTGINPNTGENIKATDQDYISSYDLTATDATYNKSTKFTFKVAALSFEAEKYDQVLDANDKAQTAVRRSSTVAILNGTDYENAEGYKNLVPSVNVQNKETFWNNNNGKFSTTTTNVAGADTEYVSSQQVTNSKDSAKDHTVYLNSDVYLRLPGTRNTKSEATVKTQAVEDVKTKVKLENGYGLYEDDKQYIKYDSEIVRNFDRVDYATLVFNKLNLSKYTDLVVYAVDSKNERVGDNVIKLYGSDGAAVKEASKFGLQIPLNDLIALDSEAVWDPSGQYSARGLCLELRSEGTVDLKNNEGYEISSLDYHYKTEGRTDDEYVKLEGASINWEKNENPLLENEEVIYDKDANVDKYLTADGTAGEKLIYDTVVRNAPNLGDSSATAAGATLDPDADATTNNTIKSTYTKITYQVPTFPNVGNAIIRVYEGDPVNGYTVKRYYACETGNLWGSKNINREGEVRRVWTNLNKNVLRLDTNRTFSGTQFGVAADTNMNIYLISEDEVKERGGNPVQVKDGVWSIDSTESGQEFLKGTLTFNDDDIDLDEDHKTIYSYIMWNPVQNKVNTHESFIALKGQTITLTAQLIDKMNNKAAESGYVIEVKAQGQSANTTGPTPASAVTDKYGQATFTVTGTANLAYFKGLIPRETSDTFDVVFKVGDSSDWISVVDLYWVDAKLAYINREQTLNTTVSPAADIGKRYTRVSDGTNLTEEKLTQDVGEKWGYMVQVVPVGFRTNDNKNGKWDYEENTFGDGKLAGWYVDRFEGVIPSVTLAAGSVGVKADGTTHTMIVDTNVADATGIADYSLASVDCFKDAKVRIKKADGSEDYVTFIGGAGATTINETMRLSYYVGKERLIANTIETEVIGTTVAGNTRTTFFKITNSKTKAPVAENTAVVFSTSADSVLSVVNPTAQNQLKTARKKGDVVVAYTNAEGVAAVTVTYNKLIAADGSGTATVTATAGTLAADEKSIDTTKLSGTGSQTFTFKNPKIGFAFGTLAVKDIDFNKNTITLSFNKNIVASSVIKEEFKVFYGKDTEGDGKVDADHANNASPVAAYGIDTKAESMKDFTQNIDTVTASGNKVTITLLSDPLDGNYDKMLIVQTTNVDNTDGTALKNSKTAGIKYVNYQITSEDGETLANGAQNIVYKRSALNNDPAVTGYDLGATNALFAAWSAAYLQMMSSGTAADAALAQKAYDDLLPADKAYVTSEQLTNLKNAQSNAGSLKSQVLDDAKKAAEKLVVAGNGLKTAGTKGANESTITIYDVTTGANANGTLHSLSYANSANGTLFNRTGEASVVKGTEYYIVKATKAGVSAYVALMAKATEAKGTVTVTSKNMAEYVELVGKLGTGSSKAEFDDAEQMFKGFAATGAFDGTGELTAAEITDLERTLNEARVLKLMSAINTNLQAKINSRIGGNGSTATITNTDLAALLGDLDLTGDNAVLSTDTYAVTALGVAAGTQGVVTETLANNDVVVVSTDGTSMTFKLGGTSSKTATIQYRLKSDVAGDTTSARTKICTITVTNNSSSVTLDPTINN